MYSFHGLKELAFAKIDIFFIFAKINLNKTVMKRLLHLFMIILTGLMISACSEDSRLTKNLYDDWWPVHAKGSVDNDPFFAKWDADVNPYGNITVEFKHKSNPTLSYIQTYNYPALSFDKKKESFKYYYLNQNYRTSTNLNFYVKEGNLYLEKINPDTQRGSGAYDSKPISFKDDNTLQVGDVTYQRYSYYKEKHPTTISSASPGQDDGEMPDIIIY